MVLSSWHRLLGVLALCCSLACAIEINLECGSRLLHRRLVELVLAWSCPGLPCSRFQMWPHCKYLQLVNPIHLLDVILLEIDFLQYFDHLFLALDEKNILLRFRSKYYLAPIFVYLATRPLSLYLGATYLFPFLAVSLQL